MQLRGSDSCNVIWTNIVTLTTLFKRNGSSLFAVALNNNFETFRQILNTIFLLQNVFVMGVFLLIPWSVSEQKFFRIRLRLKGRTKLAENKIETFSLGCESSFEKLHKSSWETSLMETFLCQISYLVHKVVRSNCVTQGNPCSNCFSKAQEAVARMCSVKKVFLKIS